MEKSIIFTTEEVRATLDGRKTQKRIPIPGRILDKYYEYDEYCDMVMPRDIPCKRQFEKEVFMNRTPYQPGDILWVRETWMHAYADTTVCGSTYTLQNEYIYKADNPDITAKWRPSIHMPRKAARLFLRVKEVRVERLQALTEEDAKAEGFAPDSPFKDYGFQWSAKENFEEHWDILYAKKGYPWDSNPWVFVNGLEKH